MSFSVLLPIPVILVPVTPIEHSKFQSHASLIRVFSRVPLQDIPIPNPSTEDTSVFVDFNVSSSVDVHTLDGHPFRDRPLAVVGVVDCSEWDDLSLAAAEFEKLCQKHAVLATRCYGFEPKEGQKETDGIISIPSVGDRHFYVGTLVADLVASVLLELESLVHYV
jgi:hypothetical protein